MSETQEQQEERVYRHVIEAQMRIEQDIAATSDHTLQRIEMDAATLVALSLVNELLPEHIQNTVQEIIRLHDTVWELDNPPTSHTTPRKPLGRRLIERISFFHHTAPARQETH